MEEALETCGDSAMNHGRSSTTLFAKHLTKFPFRCSRGRIWGRSTITPERQGRCKCHHLGWYGFECRRSGRPSFCRPLVTTVGSRRANCIVFPPTIGPRRFREKTVENSIWTPQQYGSFPKTSTSPSQVCSSVYLDDRKGQQRLFHRVSRLSSTISKLSRGMGS